MNFLKKPDKLMPLDSWLFGDDIDNKKQPPNQVRSAPTSRPISPAQKGNGQSAVLMLNPKFVAAATDAANKLQDTYKKMSHKALNAQYPMPISKRFRKLLKARERKDKATDQFLLSPRSYTRLRSYTPASLPEIVKDPKKLPYLLSFLSETQTLEGKTNYHQVLLFLIELEQQRDVAARDVQRAQLLKLFNKYFSKTSEFNISSTLELTDELEQLVLASIQNDDVGWHGFRPIQKLAFKRLAREEFPRFLKSNEYLKMMMEVEQNAVFVPMDRFLTHPRAAHYFLLFLMQQRQHFELYVWLHVEYVIKPAAEASSDALFWSLVTDLAQKASVDSAAIQDSTKAALQAAITAADMNAALAALKTAQQEIVLLLSASWYERFVKSQLYLLALNDRSSKKLLDSDSDTDDQPSYSEYDTEASIPLSSLVHHEEESDDSDDDDDNYASDRLDLESIIRSTNLPTGLQVHYRPNYAVTGHTLSDLEATNGVDAILLFKTSLERSSGLEVSYVRRTKDAPPATPDGQRKIQELAKRIQPFLVPNGNITTDTPRQPAIFPFLVLQNGHDDNLYGVTYVISCPMDAGYGVQGMCVLSTYPLIDSLRHLVKSHRLRHGPENCMLPDAARELYVAEKSPVVGIAEEFVLPRTLRFLDLPTPPLRLDFSLDEFFGRLSTAAALEVLANALLEHSVIFVSSSYTALTTCAEAVRALLNPFSWCHIYIPLLPKALLSYLQCPTPILVGVHQATTTRDDLPIPSDAAAAVVVDLDRGTLEYLGARRVVWGDMGLNDPSDLHIRVVDAFYDAKAKLDAINPWSLKASDGVEDIATGVPSAQSRRAICHELVSSLLINHNAAALVVGDAHESVIMFDEKKFTSLRPPHETPFLECLVRTQSFSEIISTHRVDVQFADEAAI
ncbi:unnamed protein product [Aphanomyces euteiches]|uniref:UDENN domain-containing protein n=1 Tax=Aphanomyces euteiches TaxID=100861 RepID=A0A6G0WW91_9STRA|nr:hypothetical protein Ae201684_011058 [Aphanomyces euteiches]KAH9058657.1 hypothetical protein Ae201684P_005998 [Aphanomyces euteiches]KAH9132847.1 hypothetical protein AeRB84_020911 [Aphanomyces euteiches]